MKNIAVITHGSDIDGIGSAALIKMKYSVDSKNIFFSDLSGTMTRDIIKEVGKMKRRTILFITDVSPSGNLENFEKLLKSIKKKGGHIFWFDHHVWNEDAIIRLTSSCDLAVVGENNSFCATEITRKELALNDAFTEEFTKIVHYSDFNLTPKNKRWQKLIKIYTLGISYYNMITRDQFQKRQNALRKVLTTLSKRKFFDKSMLNASKTFERLNDTRTRLMLKTLTIRGNIAIGFSSEINATYGCGAIIKKAKTDVGIYVNPDRGKVHLRSVRSDISKLAEAFGGGGHPHAAGFDINLKRYNFLKSESDRARLMDTIFNKAKELGIN